MIRLLPTIGTTLESLHIFCCCEPDEKDYNELSNVIQDNCNRLSTIRLPSEDVVYHVAEQRYASFLSSFGYQLINANIEDLGDEQLLDVIEKCGRLDCGQFSASYINIHDAKRICIIGSRLNSLAIVGKWFFRTRMGDCTSTMYQFARIDSARYWGLVFFAESSSTASIVYEH